MILRPPGSATARGGIAPVLASRRLTVAVLGPSRYPVAEPYSGGLESFVGGLVAGLRARFAGADIYAMYGLTEAFRSTYLDPSLIDAHPDAMGRAIPFAQVSIERATEYAAEDAEMALHVHQALLPQIEAEAGLADVYRRIEMPASAVLARIERTGVLIDSALLAAQSQALAERRLALEQEAFALAGQPFNLGSPKQIGEILFGKLGLPVGRKTASGAPSTDEEVLAELGKDYPLPVVDHEAARAKTLLRYAAAAGRPV